MTTVMVATLGGHISELVQLDERLPPDDRIWVAPRCLQTEDLLSDRRVEWVPEVGERDHLGVLRAVRDARRLYRRLEPDRVISTGSAIALGYLPVAAAMGVEAHFIECSSRIETISVSGRVLARVPGVRCWWQVGEPPPGFTRLGGVFDRYRVHQRPAPAAIRRVVVTTGTTDWDFRRLVERLVAILPADVEVLWQTGASTVNDLDIEAHAMLPESQLRRAMAEADVVVGHSGTGTLALSLQCGRSPVLVPRRSSHGEQIDDHQIELARWASHQGLAVWAEADELTLDDLMAAASRYVIETSAPILSLIRPHDRRNGTTAMQRTSTEHKGVNKWDIP